MNAKNIAAEKLLGFQAIQKRNPDRMAKSNDEYFFNLTILSNSDFPW